MTLWFALRPVRIREIPGAGAREVAGGKFYAKLSKCLFSAPCIDFCGFTVSAHGVVTQPDKIAFIRGWYEPTNVKQVRSFLGVCGFYQRFIQSCAKITAPLTDLLKKDCVWSFNEVHRTSVARLKLEFERSAVLAFPDPSKEYIIHLDASDFAVGATLSHADTAGCVKLVACM